MKANHAWLSECKGTENNPLDISITEKTFQSNGKPLQIVDGSATRGVILSMFIGYSVVYGESPCPIEFLDGPYG